MILRILFAIFILSLNCFERRDKLNQTNSKPKEINTLTTISDELKNWQGWGGHPENPKEEPFDYYYDKKNYQARASEKAIAKKIEVEFKKSLEKEKLKNKK